MSCKDGKPARAAMISPTSTESAYHPWNRIVHKILADGSWRWDTESYIVQTVITLDSVRRIAGTCALSIGGEYIYPLALCLLGSAGDIRYRLLTGDVCLGRKLVDECMGHLCFLALKGKRKRV